MSLLKLHGPDCEVEGQINSIQKSLLKNRKTEEIIVEQTEETTAKDVSINLNNFLKSFQKTKRNLSRPEVLKPFLIIILLSVIQQFSGMSILRAYVVKIFGKIFENSEKVEGHFEGDTLS